MEFADALTLLHRARPPEDADQPALTAAVAAIQQLESWLAAQRLRCRRLLARVDALAEVTLTEAARNNPHDAHRLRARSVAVEVLPTFGAALEDGAINPEHLDELAASVRRLGPCRGTGLRDVGDALLDAARTSTPEQFRTTLRRAERDLDRADGIEVRARQLGAVRLRRRTDPVDGMHQFTLRLDPFAGVKLEQAVNAATEALFHGQHPPHAPADPLERHAFLRAHALLAMVHGDGVRLGRPEITVVVDTRTGVLDWGIPGAEVPAALLGALAARAQVRTVTVSSEPDGPGLRIVDAPGEQSLGRSTRLASAAQRRTLRAVYPTCAVPGCGARFDHCTIHHVHWWRHDGRTDLDNLVPLCHQHHHAVHDAGWQLQLTPDRVLTVTRPDGTKRRAGPPPRGP